MPNVKGIIMLFLLVKRIIENSVQVGFPTYIRS